MDEEQRQEEAGKEPEEMAEKSYHSRFNQDGLLDLLPKPAHGSQNTNIPLSLNDQGVQGVDDSQEGDKDGDELKRISNGKSLVKDLKDFVSQFAMGDDKDLIGL